MCGSALIATGSLIQNMDVVFTSVRVVISLPRRQVETVTNAVAQVTIRQIATLRDTLTVTIFRVSWVSNNKYNRTKIDVAFGVSDFTITLVECLFLPFPLL